MVENGRSGPKQSSIWNDKVSFWSGVGHACEWDGGGGGKIGVVVRSV